MSSLAGMVWPLAELRMGGWVELEAPLLVLLDS